MTAEREFLKSLFLHKKFVFEAGTLVGGIPLANLINHDASKFTEYEFPYYADWFHGTKSRPDNFARAWLHHIHHNDHHFQHWVFSDGYHLDGAHMENGKLLMPEVSVREMVADQMGASMAYTGSWDMTDWLRNKAINHLPLMHSQTVALYKIVLRGMGYEVDTIFKGE